MRFLVRCELCDQAHDPDALAYDLDGKVHHFHALCADEARRIGFPALVSGLWVSSSAKAVLNPVVRISER